jgi:hypothetical protein
MKYLAVVLGFFLAGCAFDTEYAMGPATCRSKEIKTFFSTQLNTVCWQGDKVVAGGVTPGTAPAELVGAGIVGGSVIGASAVVANQVGTKVRVKVGP